MPRGGRGPRRYNGGMIQPHLAPIEAAGLLLTDWCSARCRHCYVRAGPEGSAWMTADEAAGHLAALARMGVAAGSVHVGGGEPFGDFDLLIGVVRAARSAGLAGVGYVETNGYWATSGEVVRERLTALAEAGMMQLAISADPYHQEFVPPERVRRLYEAAREVLGPRGVRVRRWKWIQQPRDVAAMPEAAREVLFAEFLARYPERMSGRAAERLAPLVGRMAIADLPDTACRAPLLESRHVHVLPGGWVYPGTCAGIALGRATAAAPLDVLLARWRPEASPLVARLVEAGPKGLAAEASRHGFEPDPGGYAGPCHLCWAVRSHLVRAGPGGDELAPAERYAGS